MERGTADWYEALAGATNQLKHARRMVVRWEQTVREREAAVVELTGVPIVQDIPTGVMEVLPEQAPETEQAPA